MDYATVSEIRTIFICFNRMTPSSGFPKCVERTRPLSPAAARSLDLRRLYALHAAVSKAIRSLERYEAVKASGGLNLSRLNAGRKCSSSCVQ